MENGKLTVLICDDNPAIAKSLTSYLEEENMEVVSVENGEKALQTFAESKIDLIILDIMMPGISGIEVCREIRKTSQVPIIMLSARADVVDRIVGLEIGADDYVVKPFSPHEVAIRARKLMRLKNGSYGEDKKSVIVGNLSIYPDLFEAYISGNKLTLTSKEFKLLLYLAYHFGIVMTREQILNGVWGIEYVGEPRTVDALVKRLRHKLVDAAGEDSDIVITTIFGIGYKLEKNEDGK